MLTHGSDAFDGTLNAHQSFHTCTEQNESLWVVGLGQVLVQTCTWHVHFAIESLLQLTVLFKVVLDPRERYKRSMMKQLYLSRLPHYCLSVLSVAQDVL